MRNYNKGIVSTTLKRNLTCFGVFFVQNTPTKNVHQDIQLWCTFLVGVFEIHKKKRNNDADANSLRHRATSLCVFWFGGVQKWSCKDTLLLLIDMSEKRFY